MQWQKSVPKHTRSPLPDSWMSYIILRWSQHMSAGNVSIPFRLERRLPLLHQYKSVCLACYTASWLEPSPVTTYITLASAEGTLQGHGTTGRSLQWGLVELEKSEWGGRKWIQRAQTEMLAMRTLWIIMSTKTNVVTSLCLEVFRSIKWGNYFMSSEDYSGWHCRLHIVWDDKVRQI